MNVFYFSFIFVIPTIVEGAHTTVVYNSFCGVRFLGYARNDNYFSTLKSQLSTQFSGVGADVDAPS